MSCLLGYPALVFHEVFRHLYLAYIMIIGTNPCQKRVYAYGLGCRLNEVSDNDAVMVCAGGIYHKGLHQGLVEVQKLKKADIRGDLKDIFKKRKEQRNDGGDRYA